MAMLAADHARRGHIAIVAAISPFRSGREDARAAVDMFLEVFVDAPLAVCEQRDPLGLYRRFRNHQVTGLAGVDAPYDVPTQPDVHCHTDLQTIEECTATIIAATIARLEQAT